MFSISCCGIPLLLVSFFRLLKLHLRKSILPQLSPARRRNGVLSVFCRLCFFSLRILPLSYLKMKTQPPVKPFGLSASAWRPVSEIVLLL